MKVSFEGMGELVATFYNGDESAQIQGKPVAMSGSGEVEGCGEGERFMGIAVSATAEAAAVQLGGYVRCTYSGTAPSVGYVQLVADGSGGVAVDEDEKGSILLVLDVDTAEKTVGFML